MLHWQRRVAKQPVEEIGGRRDRLRRWGNSGGVTDRRLLLSLLLLPACGPAVPSSEDDPREPDGGDPDQFQSSCRKFFEGYQACYEGYGSSGYAYETGSYDTESYDPAEYAEAICESYEEYAAAYGRACIGAMEEVFACVSSLDCEVLYGDDADAAGFVPEPCRAVYADAASRCPEMIPQCGSYGISGSLCDVEVSECIDGNTYGVTCDAGGAGQSCRCALNGAVTREVTIGGDFECGDEGWTDEVEDACGFPPGVF